MKEILLSGLLFFHITTMMGQEYQYDLSDRDPNKPIVFYLHGRIVEDMGLDANHKDFGKYEYLNILETFASRGFNVHSEIRDKDTDIVQYAGKITGMVEYLIDSAGVDPTTITIIGASKGSMIAMMVSTQLKREDVNFVLIAACNDYTQKNFDVSLCGRILSIYEKSDGVAGSCRSFFNEAQCELVRGEIQLNTGLGHGMLFRPIKEWVNPAVKWANLK